MALPIGLVLAGGAGRRLGVPKGALCPSGGESLAERAAATLEPLCRGVRISIAPGGTNPAPAHPAIEDRPPGGEGPLAGIRAAFDGTGDADLLVLACDYPLVPRELLARIVEAATGDAEIVLVRDAAGRDHPLVALWRRASAERVSSALERGERKVEDLVRRSRTLRLSPSDLPGLDLARLLLNVNTPDDLEHLRD